MDILGIKALLISALIFIPLEQLLAERPQKIFRKGFAIDIVYAVFNGFLVKAALVLIGAGAIGAAAVLLPEGIESTVGAQPVWLQVVEIIVIADIGLYAAHRAFHEIPWLWKFHAIHHSIEELDWLATFRSHPVDMIATKAVSLLPVYFFGFSGEATVIFALIAQGHSLLLHSNIRLPLGPLKVIIAGPQFHHWHHANRREAYDKNYASQLALLDAVFGTYQVPGSTLPDRYGVDDPIPSSYFGQAGYPFAKQASGVQIDTPCPQGQPVRLGSVGRNEGA